MPPLSDELKYGGNTPSGARLLDGTYDTSPHPPDVARLLEYLSHTADMLHTPISLLISEKEFLEKLKVWRESTTTSPSGLHLGHYKALYANHRYSNADDDDLSEEQKEEKMNSPRCNSSSLNCTSIS